MLYLCHPTGYSQFTLLYLPRPKTASSNTNRSIKPTKLLYQNPLHHPTTLFDSTVTQITSHALYNQITDIVKSFDLVSSDTCPCSSRPGQKLAPPSRPLHHRRSQSRSPNQNPSGSSNQEKMGRYQQSSDRQSFCPPDAKATPLSACAICLGRHRHIVGKCNSATLWSGQPSTC
jgi:hypothetical protein